MLWYFWGYLLDFNNNRSLVFKEYVKYRIEIEIFLKGYFLVKGIKEMEKMYFLGLEKWLGGLLLFYILRCRGKFFMRY